MRPGGFASIIGQQSTIERLKHFAALYSQAGKAPGHVLLTGPEGVGKRTLARAFVTEFCSKFTEVDGKSLVRQGNLLGILTNLAEGDALVLGDVTKVSKAVVEFMQSALGKFAVEFTVGKGWLAKTINLPLKRFTCVATVRSKAECPPELVEAFPLILSLQAYSQPEMVSICEQLAQCRGITIARGTATLICGASTGTPHHIALLIDRLAQLGRATFSEEDVALISSVLGLTNSGHILSPGTEMEALSGIDFEKAIAALLREMGFHTEFTRATGDGGVDIVATLDRPLVGGRYLIQCKRFGPGKLVGAATVRDFYGALTADRLAVKGILITNSAFTTQALEFARQLPIELIGGQVLRELLAKYRPVADGDLKLDQLAGPHHTLFDS